MAQVTIYRDSKTYTISMETGKTLLDALRAAGVHGIDASCGGRGICGKCLVSASGAVSDMPAVSGQPIDAHRKLACRTVIEGDCMVTLSGEDGAVTMQRGILSGFPPNRGAKGLGAAVDIGTTTVVLYLTDLSVGEVLAIESGMNRQRSFGGDVISRVRHCMDHPDGLKQLAGAIRGQVDDFLRDACEKAGHRPSEVVELAVAGNTIMEHIFTGLSPRSIALAPFTPLSLFGKHFPAEEMGLSSVNPGVSVYLAPCVAGYVGGDITAGLLSSGAYRSEGHCLFLDIGTNGEMALGSQDGFLCCATAAGPAFEGAEITCGMSGVTGAVSHIWPKPGGGAGFEVIGGGTARGICGSGLVDLLALLLRLGAVDETGRLLRADEAPESLLPYLGKRRGRPAFCLTREVFLTDQDVRKLQLAKAAVAAGIRTLLDTAGLRESDISALYLAGGFGNYIDHNRAADIGLLPKSLVKRLIHVGNSAGTGALAALVSQPAREALSVIQKRCSYLELSSSAAFNEQFVKNMTFDESLFQAGS